MKKLIVAVAVMWMVSCNNQNNTERSSAGNKQECDSVEQEMFDENGNVYYVKVAVPCDTLEQND